MSTAARLAALMGAEVRHLSPLAGGCIAEVARADLADGRSVVVKSASGPAGLDEEAAMLDDLARLSSLPVPRVLHAAPDLLVMTWIDNDGGAIGAAAQEHAAELIAALHDVTTPLGFGYGRGTLIGGLPQPNGWMAPWRDFFRERRLLYMAHEAHRAGRLPSMQLARLETLAGRLERWIHDDAPPSLIHGDLWTGNVLLEGGRIAGFVDPAIYFADAEIELAFATLFGTFGDAFFRRYGELRPLRPGFFEERRDLYNLYPLLVHVRLFGGGYVAQVARTLDRYGV